MEQTHVLKKVVVFVPVDGKNPIQFLKDHGYASKDVRDYGEAETQDPNRTSFLDLKILFKAKSCGLKFFMLNLYAAEYYFLPPGWYHFFFTTQGTWPYLAVTSKLTSVLFLNYTACFAACVDHTTLSWMTRFKPEGVRPAQRDEVALPPPVTSAVQAGISSVESLVSTAFPIANVGTPGNSQVEYLRIRDMLVESINQYFSEVLIGTRGGSASSGAGFGVKTGKGPDRRRRHTDRSDDTDDVVLISLDSWTTLDHNIREPDGFENGTEVRRVRQTTFCFSVLLMPVSIVQITSYTCSFRVLLRGQGTSCSLVVILKREMWWCTAPGL